MSLCQYAKGQCTLCHRPLMKDQERECKGRHQHRALRQVARSVTADCPHLLEPLGEETRLFGCGCASEKKNGILVSVYGCDLHGRCVTMPRGTLADESIKTCAKCGDNPNNSPPAPAPPQEQ